MKKIVLSVLIGSLVSTFCFGQENKYSKLDPSIEAYCDNFPDAWHIEHARTSNYTGYAKSCYTNSEGMEVLSALYYVENYGDDEIMYAPLATWYPNGGLREQLMGIKKIDKSLNEEGGWDCYGGGLIKGWYLNGQLCREILIDKKGKLVYRKYWDKNGKPTDEDYVEEAFFGPIYDLEENTDEEVLTIPFYWGDCE